MIKRDLIQLIQQFILLKKFNTTTIMFYFFSEILLSQSKYNALLLNYCSYLLVIIIARWVIFVDQTVSIILAFNIFSNRGSLLHIRDVFAMFKRLHVKNKKKKKNPQLGL